MTVPFAMRSPIEFRMTVMCSTGRPNMVSSGPCWLTQRPIVYAQGGAISSPRTAETDQPTVRMSSATARMQASGSRSMPPACASHSAHLHRWSAGLARRLRDGFISDTLRGGYDLGGPLSGRGPGPVLRVRPGPVLRVRPGPVLRVRPGPVLRGRGDAEMPLDRAQPALDVLEQAVNGFGQLAAPLRRRGGESGGGTGGAGAPPPGPPPRRAPRAPEPPGPPPPPPPPRAPAAAPAPLRRPH